MKEFLLQQEYIELNKLLKFEGLVETGGEAKQRITAGEVSVNGETELRIRRKLHSGDTVIIGKQKVVIK